MNFSSSYSGGGLRRLVETAKCFDKRDGCYFIIHQKAYKYLKDYCKNNVYYVVTQNKIRRLFDDGYYLQNILDVIGTPDIYFSYGIPIFFRIGKVNWFHISNALSLTTQKINMPIIQRLKMILLKYRILKSLNHVQIISGESEFSLNLIKSIIKLQLHLIYFSVLPNGINEHELNSLQKIVNDKEHYAVTIGTYAYKNLGVAFRLFKYLKEKDKKLKTFIIIGNIDDLPIKLRVNKNVIVDKGATRESVIDLLSNAKYYISASQIENSSIAALEGLIFSKSVILSDIPSHREMLKDIHFEELFVKGIKDIFLVANNESNLDLPNIYSWEEATLKFYEIYRKYKEMY